jgi:hypothetical protein
VQQFLRSLQGRSDLSDIDRWRVDRLLDGFANGECFRKTGHLVMWPSNSTLARVFRRSERQIRYHLRKLEAANVIALLWPGNGRHGTAIYEFHGLGLAEAARTEKGQFIAPFKTEKGTIPWSEKEQSSVQERGNALPPTLVEENRLKESSEKRAPDAFLENGGSERQSRAASRRARPCNNDPAWKTKIKQRWEQNVSTEIIHRHGPEQGMAIINSYMAGEPAGKRIFNLTDQTMRQNEPTAFSADGNDSSPDNRGRTAQPSRKNATLSEQSK